MIDIEGGLSAPQLKFSKHDAWYGWFAIKLGLHSANQLDTIMVVGDRTLPSGSLSALGMGAAGRTGPEWAMDCLAVGGESAFGVRRWGHDIFVWIR